MTFGTLQDDIMTGTAGVDTLLGLSGDDTLISLSGSDSLFGGDGMDTADYSASGAGVEVRLNGGANSDQLTGGGGADTFEFTVTVGIDRITDWQDGTDVLDFTADGLGFGDFAVSTFGGGAGTSLIGGGYVVCLEGVPIADIDATDFI
ncbi:MAG: hypothetical protein AAF409_10365 [Pseudomonadota bacterium]